MKEKNIKYLENNELKNISGGIAPLLAYAVAYATLYTAAHAVAYYKGYSDAHDSLEPCK